jgi:hypothetical protein
MKKTEPWEWALGGGATVLAWYALPDVVRSKKLRSLIKAGLLGVTAYAGTMLPGLATEVEDLSTSVRKQLVDLPPKTATGILVGGTAAMAAITVLAEKWIFTRGELRRARGVRAAHTRQALAIAAATAALAATDRVARWANET